MFGHMCSLPREIREAGMNEAAVMGPTVAPQKEPPKKEASLRTGDGFTGIPVSTADRKVFAVSVSPPQLGVLAH